MRYYLIAGEASGDLHGANLIKGLREEDPGSCFRAWGGDLMQEAGATVVKHYRELAFMGFVEVVRNLRTIHGNFKKCKEDILNFQPDALILIDYPGFNLRMARWAKQHGIPVIYYIAPQIWAWHQSRIHQIKASVDQLFVILPFEKDFYQTYDYPVAFTGHPLLDVVDAYWQKSPVPPVLSPDPRPVIALLPGSRRQEIAALLPLYLRVLPDFPDYQFVLAGAPAIPDAFYQSFLDRAPIQPRLVRNQTYDLLSGAHAAMVASGTATLETALFRVPQIVCYKGNPISYLIARAVIKVPFISLVNLILQKPLVPELIQHHCTVESIRASLSSLLTGPRRTQMLSGYSELRHLLGEPGAALRASREIGAFLRQKGATKP